MTPYYEREGIVIYHGDALVVREWLDAAVLVTDPPYGIDYHSRHFGFLPRSIQGDSDTAIRDGILAEWGDRPALVFGTWRVDRPASTRQLLIWDTKGALGMGAMDLPWKPSHQEIYVIGKGFLGRRTTDVLTYAPVQAKATFGRVHPHQKPESLLKALLAKCPPGRVTDPAMGSGTTLVAAKAMGRLAIGVEIEERYCEIAAKRLSQDALPMFGGDEEAA